MSRRDMAIIRLFLDTGIRLAEKTGLQLEDVDLDRREATVLGKGRRRRTVVFGHKATLALGRYVRVRAQQRRADLPNLWLATTGRAGHGPMSDSGIYQMRKRRGQEANLNELHPHVLRHTWAHWLISEGLKLARAGRVVANQVTAAADSTGRPLVVPAAQMPQNAVAAMGTVASEGFVGAMQGLPVFVDANIPANLGTGTDEDRIIVTRAEDVVLMESIPRANVFREPLAAQLSVLLVVHNYIALHASRYPKSISVIGRTGPVTPTF